MMMLVPLKSMAQTMYTVFDTATSTLTFKYGTKPTSTDTEKVYDIPYDITVPGWVNNHSSSIQKVVFDVTFKDVRPKKCQSWFMGCLNLTTISGIENLNTEEVTHMAFMFRGCKSLTTLDLSGFNTAKVYSMAYMFYECRSLTTIFVSDKFTTSAVYESTNMFGDCFSLVGAIKYDNNIKDKTGANYRTGYFTCGINTADDLKAFAKSVNGTYTPADGETATAYPNLCAVLMKDIALTADDIMEPMGKNGSYTGTFDGRGHSISGLSINATNNSLFANNSGTIKNLGVVNAQIDGDCGGFFCQTNSGTIESSFFAGTTEGTTSPSGAICQTNSGTITNCYYLADSETDEIEGTTAMTAAQFKSGAVAWMLNGSSSDGEWGQQIGSEDYPVLGGAKVYQCSPCTGVYSNDENELTAEHNVLYDNGFGTCSGCGIKSYQSATQNASGEYEIGNAGQLCWFAGLVNGTLTDGTSQNTTAKGVLTDNIDLASISNWTPIGNESNRFGGTFDGKNFKVQNLSITQQGYYTGLFGYASGATMKNICIDGNITLNTTSYTEGYGSIAGCVVNSTISNCHSSVNFTINTEMDASENCIGHMGGIVGKMNETSSTESYVSGCSYSGTMNLGNKKVNVAAGIVGYAIYSNVPITNCSFTGAIMSKCEDALIMGGIFGYTRTSGNVKVTNCLQAGTLEKTGNSSLTGILIGQINTGYGANVVTNNYYTSSKFNVIGTTTGTPTTTPATQCSTEQLLSGEICYRLNGSSPDGGWGQKLGTDSYPVPGSPYQVITSAIDKENSMRWATFSSQTDATELSVPDGKELAVYNATVSKGVLLLNERSDNKVAIDEGVLLKTDCEYLNAKTLDETVTKSAEANSLVATPGTKQTIKAGEGHVLYRLAYNKTSDQTGLGFYLGVATVGGTKYKDGSYINTAPGKAYLDVLKTDVVTSEGAAAYGFLFTEEENVTGIECVTISNVSGRGERSHEGIHDLTGRKVANPTKGLYIINNKKVVIK